MREFKDKSISLKKKRLSSVNAFKNEVKNKIDTRKEEEEGNDDEEKEETQVDDTISKEKTENEEKIDDDDTAEKENNDEEEENDNTNDEQENNSITAAQLSSSRIASLKCQKYEGPHTPKAIEEMVYWHDISSDSKFVSPFHKNKKKRQYLTFDPDGGGWNNIRMAMETVVGLAMAMGRTLVLPPAQGMYLLGKDRGKQNTHFSFGHFFPFDDMKESEGLDMITMETFLEETYGKLHYTDSSEVAYPPDNRTQWDGLNYKPLKEWLRNVTYIQHMWKPGDCLAAFPASGNHKDVEFLENAVKEVLEKDGNGNSRQYLKSLQDKYLGNPVPVDATPLERLQESLNGRSELCVYDEHMQDQLVVHFMCYHKMRVRYLVHFYGFLFFEDWRHDLHMKRYMRDHMRYIDEIQCAAARVVESLRETATVFDTMHIRRGDFQFKDTRIEASEIIQNSKDVLSKDKTIYIATDETDKSFFQPFRDAGYDIKFLDDFKHVLKDVNTNYYGMIDQLVASKGDVFLGCWHSTFTGFIMRMRGYHSTNLKLPGYINGTLPTSYYYATPKNKFVMNTYTPLAGAFFNREFPTSWRQIDKGVE
eukprot:CAMPEP_0194139344 /NCGR_PEP_ID=MMETSP0152-20130528/8992_1 /TAXON_ID=1049557 /ORGANISM="Thalassiothrix antarctica, Strain L6-D1" /LENGTH=589 /DNA_ID=CAMNT_0038837129 /DNA_START=325 /DNA_END=2094 /DNA_ORIENTATION=-